MNFNHEEQIHNTQTRSLNLEAAKKRASTLLRIYSPKYLVALLLSFLYERNLLGDFLKSEGLETIHYAPNTIVWDKVRERECVVISFNHLNETYQVLCPQKRVHNYSALVYSVYTEQISLCKN